MKPQLVTDSVVGVVYQLGYEPESVSDRVASRVREFIRNTVARTLNQVSTPLLVACDEVEDT